MGEIAGWKICFIVQFGDVGFIAPLPAREAVPGLVFQYKELEITLGLAAEYLGVAVGSAAPKLEDLSGAIEGTISVSCRCAVLA